MNTPTTDPAPAEPVGPACALCGQRAVVHWQRRLTDTELAVHFALEQERRDTQTALADPAGPVPAFPPMPGETDCTTVVYGCDQHGITLDLAALIHAKTCTAPTTATLPGCDCTPEPAPPEEPATAPSPLPASWIRSENGG